MTGADARQRAASILTAYLAAADRAADPNQIAADAETLVDALIEAAVAKRTPYAEAVEALKNRKD